MTDGRALRIVTSPERTIEGIRSTIHESRAAGADAVEVRVDRIGADDRGRLGSLFPAPIDLVATYRSRAEGGEGADRPAERSTVLTELAAMPFALVDVEAERDLPFADTLSTASTRPRLIVSRHRLSIAEWAETDLEPGPAGRAIAFRKVVVPATVSELLHRILPALPSDAGGRLTVHTTGPSGPLLRLWADELGFAAVYCAPPLGDRLLELGTSADPAQIPVDRLKRDRPRSPPADAALLGRPVAHSLSPELFRRWAEDAGLPGVYVPLEVQTVDELRELARELPRRGFRGVNVTHPWKSAALDLAGKASEVARRCGAANLLVFHPDGAWADNTDRDAVVRRFRELQASGRWTDGRVLVVGTGGMAAAALDGARELGARAAVVGRSPAKVAETARRFEAVAAEPDGTRAGLIVHTTTVGRIPGVQLDVSLGPLLQPGAHLLDAVYAPGDPALRETAERAGATYEDGTRLLVYQSAETFSRGWGAVPPAERVDSVLKELGCGG
ncbi:MAG TPA: type I 3-dehydroquinate dehydratase [Thermoplasmata archaeon]|nr:type I 3-dehydroquinate dehydratase [Thermoplasmata archaeon]